MDCFAYVEDVYRAKFAQAENFVYIVLTF